MTSCVLLNIRKYPYLIITEHVPSKIHLKMPNLDKPHGPNIRIDDDSGVFLDKPPFNIKISSVLLERNTPNYIFNPDEQLITYLIEN